MPIRLMLLAALTLAIATPPSGEGMEEHCRDHVAVMTGTGGHEMVPAHHQAPVGGGGHHCPPVDCVVALHCTSAGNALMVTVAPISRVLAVSNLGPRTSHLVVGRTLEPPTPPPNRSL